ncbi:hypothetical protein JCM19233_7116 [Vibrio astriarenae]|nr:hypothetical protein JCM19233_7116 [Vibrio sp. C7]
MLESNGFEPEDIEEDSIEGMSEVGTKISDSFIYDREGNERIWQVQVNPLNGMTQEFETTLVSLNIPGYPHNGWAVQPVAGGMMLHNNDFGWGDFGPNYSYEMVFGNDVKVYDYAEKGFYAFFDINVGYWSNDGWVQEYQLTFYLENLDTK